VRINYIAKLKRIENRFIRIIRFETKYISIYTIKMFITNITQAFNKTGIKYALVGGHAVAIHGAVRGTMDVDFILKWDIFNLEKTEKTLNDLGLVSRLPISANDVFHFREEYINNRNLIAWDFFNPLRPSEQVDIIITHNLIDIKTINVMLQNNKITVISKKSLIQMKKESGREQDLLDIEALEKIK